MKKEKMVEEKVMKKLGWKIAKKLNSDSELLDLMDSYEERNYDVRYSDGTLWVKKHHVPRRVRRAMKLEGKTERPNVPLKRLSKAERGFANFLWIIQWVFLILSFYNPMFLTIWLITLGLMVLIQTRDNIIDSFQIPYLIHGLIFLPVSIGLLILGSTLIELSNLDIFNTVISFNLPFMASSSTSSSSSSSLIGLLYSTIFTICLCVFFNYLEEYYFREDFELFGKMRSGWYLVLIWMFVHLFLGLSTFTLGNFLLLGIDGILFKLVYDKYGIQTSYILHLSRNIVVILFAFVISL